MPVGVLVEDAPMAAEGFDAVNAILAEGGDPKEDFERFREDRLLPAIREVAGEEAASGPSGAEVYELHDFFVKP